MSIFDKFTEALGWLQIVASPLLAGIAVGAIVYGYRKDTTGLIAGTAIATCGLLAGIIWATRVWKKQGTIHFISRVGATPELDGKKKASTPKTKK